MKGKAPVLRTPNPCAGHRVGTHFLDSCHVSLEQFPGQTRGSRDSGMSLGLNLKVCTWETSGLFVPLFSVSNEFNIKIQLEESLIRETKRERTTLQLKIVFAM